MTSEHDSAVVTATSLLRTGEVCRARARQSPHANTEVREVRARVVGDSRSGKESECECRRAVRTDDSKECLAEVRAVVRAKKRGSACGAKGGRKANVQ